MKSGAKRKTPFHTGKKGWRLYRWVLFALASVSSLVLLLFPDLFLSYPLLRTQYVALFVLLLGIAGFFVRSVGFDPKNFLARWVFSYPIAWGAFGGGWILLVVPSF